MSKTYNFTKENMARGVRPEHWWNRGLQLSPERIREAMANTRSNKEAARWLGITDVTYKKYAKRHINWAGGQWKKNLDEMLVENQPINTKKIIRLKEMLMKDGRLGYQCATCKFSEKRLTDMKAPLLLNFVNGKRSDWRIENLRWLCYNCYFLFIEDPFSNKMLQRLEAMPLDAPDIKDDAQELFQLDDFYFEHLKKLGLDDRGDVLFKEPTDTPVDDDGLSDLIDFKK